MVSFKLMLAVVGAFTGAQASIEADEPYGDAGEPYNPFIGVSLTY